MYPATATDPQVAAQILVHGMYNGSFTEKKLSDYINDITVDYVGARAIIGLGKEHDIAQYAEEYAAILCPKTE